MLIAFHKPYGVLSQFTKQEPDHVTLAEFGFPKHIYPIGRLDWDSEGLLLLSDEPEWNSWLLHPRYSHERTYHAQVEGIATEEQMAVLRKGVFTQERMTRPCKARLLGDPGYAERSVPIRFRKNIPTSWIEITLIEGKNRQVRKMTAVVKLPTLRLIRVGISGLPLGDLPIGKWKELGDKERDILLR